MKSFFPISEVNLGAWWNVGTARTTTTTFTTPPSSSSATNVKTDGTWNEKSKSWTSWKTRNCSTSLTRSTTEGTNSVLSLNSKTLMFILGENFYSDFEHKIGDFNLKELSKCSQLKIVFFNQIRFSLVFIVSLQLKSNCIIYSLYIIYW